MMSNWKIINYYIIRSVILHCNNLPFMVTIIEILFKGMYNMYFSIHMLQYPMLLYIILIKHRAMIDWFLLFVNS